MAKIMKATVRNGRATASGQVYNANHNTKAETRAQERHIDHNRTDQNINLQFTDDGIREIAEIAFEQNNTLEDIGARRLQSILEHILEDVSYEVDEYGAAKTVVVDKQFVEKYFASSSSRNLKKYVL